MNKKTIIIVSVLFILASGVISWLLTTAFFPEIENEQVEEKTVTVSTDEEKSPSKTEHASQFRLNANAKQEMKKVHFAPATNRVKRARFIIEDGDTSNRPLEAQGSEAVRGWEAVVDKIDDISQRSEVVMSEEDILTFKTTFDKLSTEEKVEYVHLALCQFKDDRVDCLARILGDEKEPSEVLDKVFDDLSNRDRDIIRPVMMELAGLSGHPKAGQAKEWLADHPAE